MERYNGSEQRRTGTYMTRAVGSNPHISATPPLEEIDVMGSEAGSEFILDQGLYYPAGTSYYGYYCTGFEPPSEWDDQTRFLGLDGPDLHYQGLQTEGLPYVYYTPTYGYAQSPYNPYNPYIPGAIVGVDGQFVGTQQYYSGPTYQHTVSSPGYFPLAVHSRSDVLPSSSAEPLSLNTGVPSARTNGAKHISTPTSVSTVTGTNNAASLDEKTEHDQASSHQIPQYFIKQGASQGAMSDENVPNSSSSQFGQVRNIPSSIQAIDHFSLGRVSPLQNSVKVTLPATNRSTDFGSNSRGWAALDKLRPRLQFGGVLSNVTGSSDVLTEQNRGPRTNRLKNQWTSPISVKAYTTKVGSSNAPGNIVIYADQYNREDFPVKYPDAKFFVIKSYSEDDVHKSIKYNVWSSTPNGNKRLDSAYEDAQRRSGGKPRNCPVFLFFSVNASGQFCGVAEMIGPVDFQKDMDFWQQDKWSGSFPVKWHIVKDVPNTNFRHIILENNENKPVTNSRDTQEIKYMQGIEMLNIFKNYALKTSLLDDFMYYEERQKVMLEKKARHLSKSTEGFYFLPPFVSPSKPSNSVDWQPKPDEILAKHEDVSNSEGLVLGDEQIISKHDADDSNSKKETQHNRVGEASNVISIMKMGSLSIDPGKSGTPSNSGAVSNVIPVMKIGSLSIDPKAGGTNDSEAKNSDSSSPDVVTVGSMPVKVNGFHASSSGTLTVGTISIDPEALKLNNKQRGLTARSTTR